MVDTFNSHEEALDKLEILLDQVVDIFDQPKAEIVRLPDGRWRIGVIDLVQQLELPLGV